MNQAVRQSRRLFLLAVLGWVGLLILFPTWFFARPDPAGRITVLVIEAGWILISSGLLWFWLRRVDPPQPPDRPASPAYWRALLVLGGLGLIYGSLNLYAATGPLTSSGDEAHHAGMFRTIGQGVNRLVSAGLPGPSGLWLVVGLAALALLGLCWWRGWQSKWHNLIFWASLTALLLLTGGVIGLMLWQGERLIAASLAGRDAAGLNIAALVRFPPLSKLIWLPFASLGWASLGVLRLPALLAWLLTALILFRTVGLVASPWLALLAASLYLSLPGTFYFGHLVYLTGPMLLFWALALYHYERYRASQSTWYLLCTALFLNFAAFLRLETTFLALVMALHWGLVAWRQNRGWVNLSLEAAPLAWLALSVFPLWLVVFIDRPVQPGWPNLLNPERLFAILNDYPFHLGLIGFIALGVSLGLLLFGWRQHHLSRSLLQICLMVGPVTTFFYAVSYMVPDHRQIGLVAYGREWQTAHRFLVSWSPFVAILLVEGVAFLPRTWRTVVGSGLVLLFLAQATVWAAPLSLPEFTSLRLRPNVEFPQLPALEVVNYVSQELATPQTRILLLNDAAGYYLNTAPYRGSWVREARLEVQSLAEFMAYCRQNEIDLVVLPLIWMDSPAIEPDLARQVLSHEAFIVKRTFLYLDQPALVVAEFLGTEGD
jgi:hypothetical protein